MTVLRNPGLWRRPAWMRCATCDHDLNLRNPHAAITRQVEHLTWWGHIKVRRAVLVARHHADCPPPPWLVTT